MKRTREQCHITRPTSTYSAHVRAFGGLLLRLGNKCGSPYDAVYKNAEFAGSDRRDAELGITQSEKNLRCSMAEPLVFDDVTP